jgi:signal transduction histidine kinase
VNHRSLAFRLTLWYALLISVAFTLVGLTTYYGVEQYLRSSLGGVLQRRSEQVQNILRAASAAPAPESLNSALELQIAPEFTNRFLRVTQWPGTLIYQSGPPVDRSFNPLQVAAPVIWPQQFLTRRVDLADGSPLLVGSIREATANGDYLIEMGASLEPLEQLRDRLLKLLSLVLPVLVLVAAGGGYLLVQRALRPVDELSQTAAHISIRDLDARLRDSVQTSQRFLADASHELRTPLTFIKGELQDLVESPVSATDTADRIGSVLEEVERLKQLVEGLLAISRLDAGDAKRELVHVDLRELVTMTTEQMRLIAEDSGIALEYAELQPVHVLGDRGRLQQVIVNLLDNALKYTPRGGTVRLMTLRSGSEGVLEITDTGIGIPGSALVHVFDRFYRVDDDRSRDSGGVGLGLSIVKAICTAHGATLEVDSTPGVGSRFRVRFPLAEDAAVGGLPMLSPPLAAVPADGTVRED